MCLPLRSRTVWRRTEPPESLAFRSLPSTWMTSEAGSTPDPRSVTPTTSRAPSLTRFDLRATAGGVESLIQKRNANFPALAAVRAVEDDVVRARGGQDRAGSEHRLAEGAEVRVQVERQRGVAGQATLVACVHDPRLDAHALRAARDDDTEVRCGTAERQAKDALRAGQLRRETGAGGDVGVAVARDAGGATFRRRIRARAPQRRASRSRAWRRRFGTSRGCGAAPCRG